jgi:tetratricopeptide (TPR) repeat protein
MKATAWIFLSYAREDEEKVEKLYQKLSDAGFKPWMDTKDILPGERWVSSIRRAIRRSDFFLACLSANSVNKGVWIQREIRDALAIWQEKLEDDIYLLPVRLEDCEAPESLRGFQWVDLFEEDGWTRLLAALKVGLERRAEVIKPAGPERLYENKQAIVTRMRGLIAQQRDNYSEAERNLREALDIWRSLGQDKDVATVLGDLGKLAHQRKKYDAAGQFYHQALELARKINDKEGQAICIGVQGELAIDQEQWTEARQWFGQELALAKEVGRVELVAQAQQGLARVWEAEGWEDRALPLAQEALKIYERLQHRGLAEAWELVERLRGKQPPS